VAVEAVGSWAQQHRVLRREELREAEQIKDSDKKKQNKANTRVRSREFIKSAEKRHLLRWNLQRRHPFEGMAELVGVCNVKKILSWDDGAVF
jgi:hypothetical protein